VAAKSNPIPKEKQPKPKLTDESILKKTVFNPEPSIENYPILMKNQKASNIQNPKK